MLLQKLCTGTLIHRQVGLYSCRDRQANLTDRSMLYLLVIPLFTVVHNLPRSYQLVPSGELT